jgi:hypothetical protein
MQLRVVLAAILIGVALSIGGPGALRRKRPSVNLLSHHGDTQTLQDVAVPPKQTYDPSAVLNGAVHNFPTPGEFYCRISSGLQAQQLNQM